MEDRRVEVVDRADVLHGLPAELIGRAVVPGPLHAGAGVKRAWHHGATDEFGWKAVEDVCTIYDLHATILHLLGLDHTRLSYYHNGIERRLTDVHGHVIKGILA